MIGADGTAVGVWGVVVFVAGAIGAGTKALWQAVREYIGVRRQSDQQKDAREATFLTLAQSQMNDLNLALRVQLDEQAKTITRLEDRIAKQDTRIEAQDGELRTLRDRVRELEA